MSMINFGTFESISLQNVIDFVKPLLLEGYPVAINTIYEEFPREDHINKFTVDVGKKGCKMAIYDPDEKACDNE